MSLNAIIRTVFSFRFIAVLALLWFLYSPTGHAWQSPRYYPYPVYPPEPPVRPVFYAYPPPAAFYRRFPAPPFQARPQPVNYTFYSRPRASRVAPDFVAPAPPVDKKPLAPGHAAQPDKQAFISQLLPYIRRENQRLLQQRKTLQQLFAQLARQQPLDARASAWLKKMAQRYRVKQNPLSNARARQQLLDKVDIIPPSLALAQAANESAWGQSRFATEANNLFGIWTYDQHKGVVPKQRAHNKKHLVRKFDHIGDSIAYYMHTLNSNPAYKKLRQLRRQARQQQRRPDGELLANGLALYSANGEKYIALIQQLIRQNEWAKLDNIESAV